MDLITKFSDIYEENLWASNESRSGPGSEAHMTLSLRQLLPEVIAKYQIKKMLDIPCGDYSWMKEVIDKSNVEYMGVDIVDSLINDLKHFYGRPNINFCVGDMRNMVLPQVDLVVSRDILFHLSYQDISKYLDNFLKSKSKYLLTTSYHSSFKFKNINIVSGDFRLLNLFEEPFNFPSVYLEEFAEPPQDFNPSRSVIMWDAATLQDPIQNLVRRYAD